MRCMKGVLMLYEESYPCKNTICIYYLMQRVILSKINDVLLTFLQYFFENLIDYLGSHGYFFPAGSVSTTRQLFFDSSI